jgi:hypothetical protein
MKRILFALCLLLLPTAPAMASPGVVVYGSGLDSCGAWLQHRKTNTWALEMQWVLGYVTGMDQSFTLMRQESGRPLPDDVQVDLPGTDAYGIAGWLDNWCRAHPVENLYGATAAFSDDRAEKNKNVVAPRGDNDK